MSKPLLSILIPTVVGREDSFDRLTEKVVNSCGEHWDLDDVDIKSAKDAKKITIGEKREDLYRRAEGLYSWQLDDDDDIAYDAIKKIIKVIQDNPSVDCITFQEHCIMDGKEYSSNHLLEYADWEGDGSKLLWDGFHFHRTPFMKSVIKTEIAKSVPIPHIRFGEDHQWAQALKPHLKTEIHIPHNLYFYQHQSSDFNTRYGFDK